MKDKLSSLISSQIPEHLRGSSPLFVSFLEAYYEFVERRKQAVGLLAYTPENRDIDLTLDEFINDFYSTYGSLIPKTTAYNRRDLIKQLKNLYEAKGSEKAIKLLFRLLYNEDISVVYPQEQMLRASGSKWVQESSIRIQINLGSEEDFFSERVFVWENASGRFSIRSTRYKKLENGLYEIFFRQTNPIKLFENDFVFSLDDSGALEVSGFATTSIARIKVLSPGKNFKRGQLFVIPGSFKNTLFRVIDTGPLGELVRTQIIDYGYKNADSESFAISPYAFAPVAADVDIVIDGPDISISPNDTQGVSDSGFIIGDIPAGSPDSYFAQDYLEAGSFYLGRQLVTFSTSFTPPANEFNTSNFTLADVSPEEIEESVATIRTFSDTVIVYPGTYETNVGNLSDPDIKLQDSFFYQIYSYVINSQITITRFGEVLKNIAHPAGQIFFSNLNINSRLDIKDMVGSFVNQIKKLQVNDSVGLDEEITKALFKPTLETIIPLEEIQKSFFTERFETLETPDEILKSFEPQILDSVVPEESIAKNFFADKNDVALGSDILSDVNSYTVDNTYFAETYVSDEARDDVYKNMMTAKSDSTAPTDTTTKSISPTVNDNQGIQESVIGANQASETFNDSVTVDDSVSKTVSRSVSDTTTTSDTTTKSVTLGKSDSVEPEDEATKSITSVQSDSVEPEDEALKSVSLDKMDMVDGTDQIADLYAAEDYFAELYVENPSATDIDVVLS